MNNKLTAAHPEKTKQLPRLTKLNLEELEEVAGGPSEPLCPDCQKLKVLP